MIQSRQFLPLACLLSIPTQWLLWTLASILTPHPYILAQLLLCGVVGGSCLVWIGLCGVKVFWLRSTCITLGLLAWGSVGSFTYAVLANETGDIEVHSFPPPTVAGPVQRLRLLDLNVLHGFPDFTEQEHRFQWTVQEFQGIDADLIVLQEAWSTTAHGCMAERLAKKLGMNYAYARANGSRERIGFEEGSAILSRYPLSNARRVLLGPQEPFWENRIALLADVDLNGEFVTIAGVHLSTSIPDAQAPALLRALPKNLLFVAGDFNAGPESTAVAHMLRAGYKNLEPWEFHASFYQRKCRVPDTIARIDHVFLSPAGQKNWRADSSVYILTTLHLGPCCRPAISDHDAVVVELRRR